MIFADFEINCDIVSLFCCALDASIEKNLLSKI